MQVPDWRADREMQMPTTCLDFARSSAKQRQWQIELVMQITITEAATIKNHGVVEQRSVTIASRSHFFKEVRQQLNVERIDFDQLGNLGFVAAIMGQRMMRLW